MSTADEASAEFGDRLIALAFAERDRQIWASRYRMCVATAPNDSARRWRAVEGLSAAHVALGPEEIDADTGRALSDDALTWLEQVEMDKLFQRK